MCSVSGSHSCDHTHTIQCRTVCYSCSFQFLRLGQRLPQCTTIQLSPKAIAAAVTEHFLFFSYVASVQLSSKSPNDIN